MAGFAAQKPTKAVFHFSNLSDRYREFGFPNDSNRATGLNVGTWPSRVSGRCELVARNLTFMDSMNQAAGQLTVMNENFVPNADNLDVEVKMGKPTLSNGKFRRTTYFFHGESGSQPGSR